MLKIIKWFLGLLVTVAVLLVLAVIIVPRVFEPNDYRDQITELVQEKTGRELQLNGDLSVSVFPWLGIRTQGLSLSQPDQIGGDMVRVETAQLRLKLMPLLSKRVEIDTVILEQPELVFITLANGVSSLTGLLDESGTENSEPSAAKTEPSAANKDSANPAAALAIVIQGVEITDGSLEWDDRQAKQRYQINDLQLLTGNLIGDDFADIELSGTLLDLSSAAQSAQPIQLLLTGQALIDTDTLLVTAQDLVTEVNYGDYALNANIGDIEFDSNRSNLTLNSLGLDVAMTVEEKTLEASTAVSAFSFDLASSQIAANVINVDADFDGQDINLSMPAVSANLDKQTASIANTELKSGDLNVAINDLKVTNFIDNPAASGALSVPSFDAAALLKRFDIDYEAADSTVLKSVGLSTVFKGGLDQVALSNINLSLDETNLSGNFSARDFSQLALAFDLQLDSLDLDRYLPESDESDSTSSSSDSAGGAQALLVPMALFKDINANGHFKADKLVSGGVELTDIDVLVESTPGQVSITPKANLYDGEMDGSMVFTERAGESQLRVKNTIGVVDLANFLTDADVTDQLSGFGTVDLDVIVTERDGVQSNKGTIKLNAQDGLVTGFDIYSMLEQANEWYSTYKNLTGRAPETTEQGKSEQSDATGFSEIIGTFNLSDSTISNNDFQLNAPGFRISGSGDIDLAADNIDYTVNVAVVASAAGQGGEAVENLQGLTIPIRFSGSMLAPDYSLDYKALYQSLAKAKVEEKKAAYVQEKLGIETDDGKVSTKDIFRGLLEKELRDDDEEAAPTTEPTETVSETTAEAGKAADTDTTDSEATAEPEEKKELTKKERRDERKRLLLEGLFN